MLTEGNIEHRISIIDRGEEIGYLIWRKASGGTIEICDISIKKNFRRQGYGTRLIEMLRNEVKTNLIWAITREVNREAHRFYETLGFRLMAKLKDFYRFEEKKESARLYGLKL